MCGCEMSEKYSYTDERRKNKCKTVHIFSLFLIDLAPMDCVTGDNLSLYVFIPMKQTFLHKVNYYGDEEELSALGQQQSLGPKTGDYKSLSSATPRTWSALRTSTQFMVSK